MSNWIPVTERFPEIYQSVLVWCPNNKNIYCAYRSDDGAWEIFGGNRTVREEVTAWQSLPEPLEEVDE